MTDLHYCPFCGHVPKDLRDALHPSGIRWREDRGQRHYISHKDPRDGEWCWEVNCLEHEGGCGASITADSREEVVAKWNNRVLWTIDRMPKDKQRLAEAVWNEASKNAGIEAERDLLLSALGRIQETTKGSHPVAFGIAEHAIECTRQDGDYKD